MTPWDSCVPLPIQVDVFSFQNHKLTRKLTEYCARSFTHQFRSAHFKAVLVNRPGGSIKHDHLAFVQGAPQFGVSVLNFFCWVKMP